MKTQRLSKDFSEYGGDEIMSNFDGRVVQETADKIKGKPLFSTYSAWNFNGRVWWNNEKWLCEVWIYKTYIETVICDNLSDIMDNLCDKYGND